MRRWLRPLLLPALLLLAWPLMRTPLLNALLYFPLRELDGTPADAGLAFRDAAFDTDDGQRLHGWWIPSRRTPPLAHVVHFHGNAGNVSHRLMEAQLLAGAGFDVLLFDYRGYGRSTGSPNPDGTARDARAARQAALARPGVDAARLVYVGESLGGAVAVELAEAQPPAGLVLQSTFTSIRDMAREHYPLVPRALVPDAYRSIERVGALRCPVLVIHGEADEIVPFAQGEALFRAASEPKRFLRVPGAGHNDLVLNQGSRWSDAIAAWAHDVLGER